MKIHFDLLLEPTAQQSTAIKQILDEDDERFQNNLDIFEKWADSQPHLPKTFEKNLLRTYLRGNKNNLENAKKKLEWFFYCKGKFPEFFQNWNMGNVNLQKAFLNTSVMPLPKLDENGHRIIIFHINTDDVSQFDICEVLKCVWLVADIRNHSETANSGDIHIYSCENVTAAHTMKFISTHIKKSFLVGSEAFPGRLKEIHVLHAPAFVEKAIGFAKLLLKPKIRERIIIHKDKTTLKDYISENCLPQEFGGTEESLQIIQQNWINYLRENQDYVNYLENMKLVGEVPKRIQDKTQSFEQELGLGVEGSFRKLNLD